MTRSLEMVGTLRLIYWTTIFGHRNGSVGYRIYTRVPGGYRNPRGAYWASWAQVVEEERRQEVARGPLAPIRIGKGKGAAAPLLLPSLQLLLPPSPSWNRKGGQNLLGVGLPPLGSASSPWPAPSSSPLYIRRGAPHRHNN